MTLSPSTLALHERRFQAVVVGGLVTVFAIVALAPHTERALFEEGSLPSAFAAVATNPAAPSLRRFGTMEPESFARAFRTGRPAGARPTGFAVLSSLIPPAADDQPPTFFALADDMAAVLVADAGVFGPQGNAAGFQRASFASGSGSGIIGTGGGIVAPTPSEPTTTAPTTASTSSEPTSSEPTPAAPTTTGSPPPAASTPSGPTPSGPTSSEPAPAVPTTSASTPSDLVPSGPVPSGLVPIAPTTALPDPVSPVPEPGSWIMMLLGMAMVGGFTRRTRARIRAIT